MRDLKRVSFFIVMFFFVSWSMTRADVITKGEISGEVIDESGEILPGVAITLTGKQLFERSLSIVSNEKGLFRLFNLNPGNYELEFKLTGFNVLKIEDINVTVGQRISIHAVLAIGKQEKEVVVVAEAPMIETKTTQISTNFVNKTLLSMPTPERKILDLMDATPGVNDKGAYGAGGNYDSSYAQGAITSAYRLNGVDVSDLMVGNTWINPNYDTVEEIQVVGIGASAEYGNFTGATVNIVTKSGTNSYHGGLSLYYTDSNLYGDNSRGIEDLKPGYIKNNPEASLYLGGPLIKERLFLFLAGGFTSNKSKVYLGPAYTNLRQYHFQSRLDWLVTAKNTLTLMVNTDPLDHKNLGLMSGMGPEIAETRKIRSTALYASWQSIFSSKAFLNVKYAGFLAQDKIDPVAPNAAGCMDYSTATHFGSSGFIEDNRSTRNEVDANLTYYADDFLKTSHEFKFGVEYEKSIGERSRINTGDVWIYIFPYGNYKDIRGLKYSFHPKPKNDRIGAYFQDNVAIGKKLTLNLGIRYDLPKLKAPNYPGTIVKYSNLSPRIGFSYDLGGNATDVFHLHYGRYYDKMVTYAINSSYPGRDLCDTYRLVEPADFPITKDGLSELANLLVRPENLWYSSTQLLSDLIPFEPGTKSPHTDAFNIGYDKQLWKNFALSVDYIYKRDGGILTLEDHTAHTYEPFQWTDPWLGNTLSLWRQTDSEPVKYYYTNSSWAKRRHHFVIIELRKRESGNWSMMASFTYQNSKGNIDNSEGPVLGWSSGLDTDPNFSKNPLQWGNLRYSRTYQFKLLATYILPWGFSISGDSRILSGLFWQPEFGGWEAGTTTWDWLPLEQRGNRRFPAVWNTTLRISKSFRMGNSSKLECMADFINVFNKNDGQFYYTQPYDLYGLSKEPAMGKPQELYPPFHVRFGIRWMF